MNFGRPGRVGCSHFARLTRLRRFARDFEQLPATLAGLHYLAFACLLPAEAVKLFGCA